MPKVKIKAGFRYDIETVLNADPDWNERCDVQNEQAKEEIKKELDSMFSTGDEGVISDWTIEVEEVSE